MSLNFADAIQVGRSRDLVEVQRGVTDLAPIIPVSTAPRGLALRRLHVTRSWDGLWSLLGRRQDIYFLTVAFDISEHQPVVLPPSGVPTDAVHRVKPGEAIEFTLGDGAPVFPPRVISGGLLVYIMVCEADKGARHVGEVMAKVHENLTEDGSLIEMLAGFVRNPASALTGEILKAATAALQPIATILQNSRDDYIGLFSGIYPARGPWAGRLTGTSNGTTIELGELRTE